MRVGFTGTRVGMTGSQAAMVKTILQKLWVPEVDNWFHHGTCVGSDEEAAESAREIGYKLHGHPPVITWNMSRVVSDVLAEPKDYLVRNRDIVDFCSLLIATPLGQTEFTRSGTWATWRYAGKVGKPRVMVFPDGSCSGDLLGELLT